jgi:hypothetical protein
VSVRGLVAVPLLLLVAGAPAMAQPSFLCVAELRTQFLWNDDLQEWKAASIETDAVYLVMESYESTDERPLYGVWQPGDPTGYVNLTCAPEDAGAIRCSGGEFILELAGGYSWSDWWQHRFVYVDSIGFFSNPAPGPSIEIGACTPLRG